MQVQVVFQGRQYDRAETLPTRLTLPDGASVDEALNALAAHFAPDRPLPHSCLIAVSGIHLGTLRNHQSRQLRDGDELLVLAPVAGG